MSDSFDALQYHACPTPGKIQVLPTKPCHTARDLALAYSPGVAEPCKVIAEDEEAVYRYTSKGNLVAVISNGTAVLGLGNIGPSASKPVMEGKGILFKTFADIDVFDIELKCDSIEHFISTVKALAPTFGGINLEDIKSPECFEIEEVLARELDIPVFHDDQHGTAIITAAAMVNALDLAQKKLDKVRVVVSGAGAAAIACMKLLFVMGLREENVLMCDSVGVIYLGREEGMNAQKEEFARQTSLRTLAEAMRGADVFIGLSTKGLVTSEMIQSMADNPIVFAMANPDPEIDYPLAKATREDIILATGRSDYPNQVNNVLGFPYIFRGALDVRAREINTEMKLAAVNALASLAREPVPESVRRAYGNAHFSFGRDYFIPKPFDPRVLYYVAPAVALAAMDTGVARKDISVEDYVLSLKSKQNHGRVILSGYHALAKRRGTKTIALAEGENPRVIKAALMAKEEGIAEPILLGNISNIREQATKLKLNIECLSLLEPAKDSRFSAYIEKYYGYMSRKGVTLSDAKREMQKPNIFANTMLSEGSVDGLICGVDRYYPDMVRPILEIVRLREDVKTAAGLYLVSCGDRVLFFADTSINIDMDSEKLANIAILAAEFAKSMDIVPRVAMLSYSNFGSVRHPSATLVRRAKELVQKIAPELEIDGEMQADTAVVEDILTENYPFCALRSSANVLIFPDMQSGNIAYKLLQHLGGARVVGPVILGLRAPAYVMQRHASVDEIFNMITVAAAQAVLASNHLVGV